jgi:hypothetical protein
MISDSESLSRKKTAAGVDYRGSSSHTPCSATSTKFSASKSAEMDHSVNPKRTPLFQVLCTYRSLAAILVQPHLFLAVVLSDTEGGLVGSATKSMSW